MMVLKEYIQGDGSVVCNRFVEKREWPNPS